MVKGMALARRLYEDRAKRAKELRAEGRRLIGYICGFPPREMITAAGMVPYRITGTLEPTTKADTYLETLMCPFVRSCFDLALKGQYDFLDGVIWPHSCDNVHKTFDIWRYYAPSPYFYLLDVPHMVDPSSFEFFAGGLEALSKSLEELARVGLTKERLNEAIDLHNDTRALLRQVSGLRKQDPPLISGTEMTQVMVAVMTTPADEANEMLRSIIEEVKTRQHGPQKQAPRLLVYGCQIDDIALMDMVESLGANVVIDDLCMGTKDYWKDVPVNGDPLHNLAKHYLGQLMCPRTFRRSPGNHRQDLESRFGHLKDFARDFGVNGAILYVLRFCDTFEYDAPEVIEYLDEVGIPALHIEDDYSLSGIGGFKTRVQAFLEMVA